MIKKSLLAAAALACGLAVTPAFAFHCPVDMQAIDAALPQASLSEADMARVKALRTEGEALHQAGKHAESVAALAEARKLLGIE